MLLAMARKAFSHSPMEKVAVGKPGLALVAEVNGQVAGAMFLKVFGSDDKKTGYLDVGFVAKEFRGHGVGRVLYPAGVRRLREMGCSHISALVIDDNVASWKSLQNAGFSTPSLTELVRMLGLGPAFSIWLHTFYSFAGGTSLWITGEVKKRSSLWEFGSFLLVNMLLYLPGILRRVGSPQLVPVLLAYPAVLLAGVLFGGLGRMLAGGKWRFGFPRGGGLLTLLCGVLDGIFPMVGRWYPQNPMATKQCQRALGVQATVEWLGMIALFCLGAFWLKDNWFFYQCTAYTANLLLYRIIPFMPFGSFGGGRVWAWNKVVFALLAGACGVLLYVVVF